MIKLKTQGDPKEYDNSIQVGTQVYIPKANNGKGAFGTISHIKETSGWIPQYFCKEHDEGLFLEEIVTLNNVVTNQEVLNWLKETCKESKNVSSDILLKAIKKFG